MDGGHRRQTFLVAATKKIKIAVRDPEDSYDRQHRLLTSEPGVNRGSAILVSAREAAILLGVSTSCVYRMAKAGTLAGQRLYIARKPAQAIQAQPHPWLRAEQRRRAELSGWKIVKPIAIRKPTRSRTKSSATTPGSRSLRFSRDDVLALKDRRSSEFLRKERRRTINKIFGWRGRWWAGRMTLVSAPHVKPAQPPRTKSFKPLAAAHRSNPMPASYSKLLAWPTPGQLQPKE